MSHYRSPIDVTDASLRDAEAALGRLDALARRWAALGAPEAEPDPGALDRFRAAMDDDMQTPAVTRLVFDLVRQANSRLDAGDPAAAAPLVAAVAEITGAVGLEAREVGDEDIPAEVVAWARERDEARAARDWPRADALRDRITEAGYVIEDTAAGTVVRRA
jgi:cysteinyl-tRNA synthetase